MTHEHHLLHRGAYARLALMTLIHFVAMFVLMYAMVDTVNHATPNINQAYMAALMTAPMLVLEVILMGAMYPHKRLNGAIVLGGLVLLAASLLFIRQQTAVGDTQFLRSMIPHHAGAVLMCNEAPLKDPEIKALCDGIVSGQRAEIDWMDAKLKRLEG